MIFLIASSIHAGIIMIMNAVIFGIGNDAFSIQAYLLQGPLVATSNILMSITLFYGVLPKKHIKNYYCCCCKKNEQ